VAEPLLDARGCLTGAGFSALRAAAPGQAPLEVAQHLASCAVCQSRLLASAREARDQAAAERTRLLRALSWLVMAVTLLGAGGLVILGLLKR
jgi:hypothetical protein